MSFLYPLFLAGVAAIGLPILAHMIRSKTRKRMAFSSLMFVPVTLPRFRNRSRIEHLLLLILRCVVLLLVVLAFSRPFFPRPVGETRARPAKRIAVLIDTSASMRRSGLWTQAVGHVRSVLQQAGPADRLCVMSFDRDTRTVMGFEQWQELEPARRVAVTAEHVSRLSPGWASTNLGNALVAAAEAIEEDEVNDSRPQGLPTRQVVLISDLQTGASLEALHTYQWPKGTQLIVKLVKCPGTTNAAMELMADQSGFGAADSGDGLGVRITNSSDAATQRFQLSWARQTPENAASESGSVYVPPGRSVVVRAPRRKENSTADRLVLTGDDHDFDNYLYVAPPLRQHVNVLYIGPDEPNDSEGMLYYVRKAFAAAGPLQPLVVWRPADRAVAPADIDAADFIIAAVSVPAENVASLRRYLQSGRTLLLVADSAGTVATLAELIGIDGLESDPADPDRYAMLGRIEFKHPLMAPFSEPRFGDFTRIHFWKYRRIDVAHCPGARVIAWFDNSDASQGRQEDPAWLEIPVGRGLLLAWTCGWRPSDSDLALSSKFVPLFYSILEYSGVLKDRRLHYFVGDHVPVPRRMAPGSPMLTIRRPDNSTMSLSAARQSFTQTDLPGFYTVELPRASSGADTTGSAKVGAEAGYTVGVGRVFAVNLPSQESRTAPMPIEDIERLGVSLESSSNPAVERTERARRRASVFEMEDEQGIWRWVLVAAFIVLLSEIWLGGRLARQARLAHGEQR